MRTFTNLGLNAGQSEEVGVYEGFVNPNGSGLMDIMQESSQDFFKLQAALYVADVVHEQATMESASQAEAVVESVVKDGLEKIKKFFMNMWSKMKAWFQRMFVMLKNMFMSGKKFIDANKKRLNEKNVLGFKYKGRKITQEEGTSSARSLLTVLATHVGKYTDGLVVKAAPLGLPAPATESTTGQESLEDEKEKLLKAATGEDEISEVSKKVRLAYFNNEEPEDADEIEDFGQNNKGELMEIVSGSAKAVRDMEKTKTETDKELAAIIKKITQAIKDVNATDKDNAVKSAAVAVITRNSNLIKYLFTIKTTVIAAAIDGIKATCKDSERILRKYINFKPAKESFGGYSSNDEPNGESLLEAAMKLI